jgi:hypothetical protein
VTKTRAHIEVEDSLPVALRSTFNAMVDDYTRAAESHTGQRWVNYKILGDLVREGWRKEL